MFLRCGIVLIALILVGCTNSVCPNKSKDILSVPAASNTTPTKEEIKARKTVKYVLEVIKPEIQKCRTEKEAVNIIEERLGAPDGSAPTYGISCDLWYLDNNACLSDGLIISEASGNLIRLRETSNKISENITQRYSMCTGPLPAYNNNSLWLGMVALLDNGTYLFSDSQLSRDAKLRKTQGNNYFFNNPDGKYTVEYLSGLKGDDLLENLKTSMNIAKITFSSSTSESKEAYFLHVAIKGRDLRFKPVQGSEIFELTCAWKNYF